MGWRAAEIGPLNQIAVLRGFADEATRQAERERYLLSADAFGIETYLTDRRAENYTLFPFLEPLAAGAHGPFYELRVYDLRAGADPQGLGKSRWPAHGGAFLAGLCRLLCHRRATAPLSAIWPYTTLEQRLEVRTRAVTDGVWPPENSGPQLRDMHSTVYLPASFSPLQ